MLRYGTKFKKDMLRWEKLQLPLLERFSLKLNVLPRMFFFLFQTVPILMTDISKFV